MTERAPLVVIGAGHNALVCATYLARAGRRVVVLEASDQPGGAACTHEFHPGFRVSSVAHLVYGLDGALLRELDLVSHGLRWAQRDMSSIALHPEQPALELSADGATAGPLVDSERQAYRQFLETQSRYASVLAQWHLQPPPRLQFGDWRQSLPVARMAWAIRRLGRRDMRELLRVATMSIDDWLQEHFVDARLQGALALDAVLGQRAGPRSGGTVFASLYRAAGLRAFGQGYSVPVGGLGGLSQALTSAARAAGVEIRCGTIVASCEVQSGRVTGVRLQSGELLRAAAVVSGVDPKKTLLSLLGARHLEAEFARRVHHVRSTGVAAKLHLALRSAPQFRGLDASRLGQRLLIAPDRDYVERAFNPVKYADCSAAPVMEIHVPSVHDATLAPAGQHVLSAVVQYAPHDLNAGWAGAGEPFMRRIIDTLAQYAPQLPGQILHAELLTPQDIECRLGTTGGHWHHGELALDQYLMLRPVPGAAQYLTPMSGLYLCSAGTHPGGGVTGAAGRLAAQAVLTVETSP
jgi:phytoene dehydrogenase-like protein